MSRRLVLLLALSGPVGLAACGGDDDGPVIRPIAADDPATLTCRGLRTPLRETCEGSYFQCQEEAGEIVEEMDVDGDDPPRERITVAYVARFWPDVDRASQTAARRGCRGGLPR